MQSVYWPITQEVKAIRQWNLVSWKNITWEKFFLERSYTKCDGILFPDSFLENKN